MRSLDIEKNPFATSEVAQQIVELIPDERERALWVQGACNLLSDDDELLATSAVHAVTQVLVDLIPHLQSRPGLVSTEQQLLAAEGIVHLALAMRAAGKPGTG